MELTLEIWNSQDKRIILSIFLDCCFRWSMVWWWIMNNVDEGGLLNFIINICVVNSIGFCVNLSFITPNHRNKDFQAFCLNITLQSKSYHFIQNVDNSLQWHTHFFPHSIQLHRQCGEWRTNTVRIISQQKNFFAQIKEKFMNIFTVEITNPWLLFA